MPYIYADTLAIATNGYWTEQRVSLQTTLAVSVVDKTALTVVVRTVAS